MEVLVSMEAGGSSYSRWTLVEVNGSPNQNVVVETAVSGNWWALPLAPTEHSEWCYGEP